MEREVDEWKLGNWERDVNVEISIFLHNNCWQGFWALVLSDKRQPLRQGPGGGRANVPEVGREHPPGMTFLCRFSA